MEIEKAWQAVEDIENKTGNLQDRHQESHYGSIPPEYGICSKCENCQVIRTKLDNLQIWCREFVDRDSYQPKICPNRYDPIIECSRFYQKGSLSLQEMKRIAWIIDVGQNKIGFATVENIVEIKQPEVE